ncbi:MAG: chemotaxis protein CheW [Porticoccaceae bacterium]|nr:MAG: chemotaxis protein CheW [Porticoccaceae bacterium]
MIADTVEPFDTLATLSGKYVNAARWLPEQEEIALTRKMVCFSLMGTNLAMALEELTEILELPQCTRLPRVKHWVWGVANLRGRLLPVINFAEFLGGRLSSPRKLHRVLVIDLHGVLVGLVVDQVYGMRNLQVDKFQRQPEGIPESFAPYAEGGFCQEGDTWILLRPGKLQSDQRFMEVAA